MCFIICKKGGDRVMIEDRTLWQRIGTVLFGVVYVAFGFWVMNHPVTTLASISLVIGWLMTISGVVLLIAAFNTPEVLTLRSILLVEAILVGLLGLMFLFGDFIQSTTILAYLLIFWILMDSALQLQFARFISRTWVRLLTIAIDVMVIAYCVYMLFNPSLAESFLVVAIGIGFIGTGINKMIKGI